MIREKFRTLLIGENWMIFFQLVLRGRKKKSKTWKLYQGFIEAKEEGITINLLAFKYKYTSKMLNHQYPW